MNQNEIQASKSTGRKKNLKQICTILLIIEI